MELGLEYTDKMAIPGGQKLFPLTGYCIPQCTGVVSCFQLFLSFQKKHVCSDFLTIRWCIAWW